MQFLSVVHRVRQNKKDASLHNKGPEVYKEGK